MSNHENSNHISKNKSNGNTRSQNHPELKLGEYYLTPLESFIINKKMPSGFKLELVENLNKLTESYNKDKKKNKKNKNLIKSTSYSYNTNNLNNKLNNKNEKKEYNQIKKKTTQENNGDIITNDISREKYKIAKKCKIAIERIKDTPLAKNFYEFNDIETPSLSKVEKKMNNYEYTSFYDFEMDIRKIWSHFFYLGEKGDKEIYENTSKMSEKWENICSELDNANDDMFETVSKSVIRRAEKNKKEIMDYKENGKDKVNKNFTKNKEVIKNENNKEQKISYDNGDRQTYIGKILNGVPNGKGTMYWNDGTRYEGEWKNNKMNGKGIYYYSNGDRYDGDFINGNAEGKGIEYYSNGDKYEGDFRNDKKEGRGIFYWDDGDRYEGEWKNDLKEGKGIFYWSDGDRYEGDFRNDKKDGKGVFYRANGDREIGDYSNDKAIGKHAILTRYGKVEEVEY